MPMSEGKRFIETMQVASEPIFYTLRELIHPQIIDRWLRLLVLF